MKNDSLCCKKMTKRSMKSLLKIEEVYMNHPDVIAEKRAVYLRPVTDPVIDLELAIKIFMILTGNQGLVKTFLTRKHYLWFTEQSSQVHEWIRLFILETSKSNI